MEEETKPQEEIQEDSSLLPVEHTPEVDERLKEFGIDISPTEEEKQKLEEEAKAAEEEVKKDEEEKARLASEEAEKSRLEAEKAKETEEEIEISEEDAQSLIEKQTGEKKKEEETYPWEAEGREPTQREVLDYVAQKAVEIQEQKQAEAQRVEKEQEESKRQQTEANTKAWQTKWEGDIKFLEEKGYINKVKNKDDPNDPGIKDRQKLLEQATLNGELDLRVVQLLYIEPTKGKQPAGVNAPVSVPGNDTTEKESDDDYYYDEVHGQNPETYDVVELAK